MSKFSAEVFTLVDIYMLMSTAVLACNVQ